MNVSVLIILVNLVEERCKNCHKVEQGKNIWHFIHKFFVIVEGMTNPPSGFATGNKHMDHFSFFEFRQNFKIKYFNKFENGLSLKLF